MTEDKNKPTEKHAETKSACKENNRPYIEEEDVYAQKT